MKLEERHYSASDRRLAGGVAVAEASRLSMILRRVWPAASKEISCVERKQLVSKLLVNAGGKIFKRNIKAMAGSSSCRGSISSVMAACRK